MNITFVNPGIEVMLESIRGFQADGETAFWSEPLYRFYPQLKRGEWEAGLRSVYTEQEAILEDKIVRYAARWSQCKAQVEEAFSDAFEMDCRARFNDLCCRVSLNPISPRYLRRRLFEVFYLNSERGAVGAALHEIVHFVWFDAWHARFHDDWESYERPSMKWILSEMVVESILGDARLSAINPYFPREAGGCVYPYFFDMIAGSEPILDTLGEMYRSRRSIAAFMDQSYAYCLAHEAEIRTHIEVSERHT